MTDPANLAVQDPVQFSFKGSPTAGHLARKSRRFAVVVTEEGSEFRVPWHLLSLRENAERRKVSTRNDARKARFAPDDEVRFRDRSGVRYGVIAGMSPATAHVVCEDGTEFRVSYTGLEHRHANGCGEARERRFSEIRKEAEQLMARHGLDRWSFQFDEALSRAGCCNHSTRTLSLSRSHCMKAPDAEIRDTVLHEIAHALVGAEHGHDAVWRAKAQAIGCSGKRLTEDPEPTARYIVSCPTCGWHQKARRRLSRARCRMCGKPVSYGTYTRAAWEKVSPGEAVRKP